LERRHPHIFGGVAETPGWDAIKAAERRAKKQESALDGVAAALPALDRALKLQKRAARTGFDWPNAAGPRAKVDEELEELDREAAPDRQREELGDLLFAVVNLARHLKIDPEEALRQANKKFERRFRAIETAPGFEQMSLDEKEELWRSAKAAQSD
jgi:ATP diphosphatase